MAAVLARWTPVYLVGYAAALAGALLPPLGGLALNRVLFRGASPWQALFPVAAWSTTYLMGFLNYQIGIGLALLFAAADPLLSRRLGRFVVAARIVIAAVLAIDHFYVLLFYAALVAALAFGPAPVDPGRWRDLLARTRRAALAGAGCALPLVWFMLFAPALPGAEAQGAGVLWGREVYKLVSLIMPLATYSLVVGGALTLALGGMIAWLASRRALRAHAGLLIVAGLMVCVTLIVPDHAAGGSWIARRIPTMVVLVSLAGLTLRGGAAVLWGPRFVMAAGALVLAQTAWVSWNWRATNQDMSQVREVIALAPPGARILPMQHLPTLAAKWSAPTGRYMYSLGDPTFRHDGALATPLRRDFLPTLFAARGLQPLRVLGAWDGVAEHNGGELPSVDALARPRRADDPRYLSGWRGRFDHLLVLNADLPDANGPFRPPPGVRLVSDAGFAQLWRIGRGGVAVGL